MITAVTEVITRFRSRKIEEHDVMTYNRRWKQKLYTKKTAQLLSHRSKTTKISLKLNKQIQKF